MPSVRTNINVGLDGVSDLCEHFANQREIHRFTTVLIATLLINDQQCLIICLCHVAIGFLGPSYAAIDSGSWSRSPYARFYMFGWSYFRFNFAFPKTIIEFIHCEYQKGNLAIITLGGEQNLWLIDPLRPMGSEVNSCSFYHLVSLSGSFFVLPFLLCFPTISIFLFCVCFMPVTTATAACYAGRRLFLLTFIGSRT